MQNWFKNYWKNTNLLQEIRIKSFKKEKISLYPLQIYIKKKKK